MRRAPFPDHRLGCRIFGRRCPLPERSPTLGLHHPLHLRLHLTRRHHLAVVSPHLHPELHLLHDEHLVHLLLRVHGPAQERQPRRDALQRRVPPAVRHESARRPVAQHVHLRRPALDHEASAIGPLQEPVWKQRAEVWLRQRLPRAHGQLVVDGARGAHHPEKPLLRPLEADGDLLQLPLGERAQAPEAEEHDAAVRLRVQPAEALVLHFPTAAGAGHQWPDAVDRWRGTAGHAQPVPQSAHRPRLQLHEGVDDDPVGRRHPMERLEDGHGCFGVAVNYSRQIRRLERRSARKGKCSIAASVYGSCVGVLVEAEVEEDGEVPGARGVGVVDGQPEFGRDVERVRAEHVDDERVDGGQRPEEVAERSVHGLEAVHHLEDVVLSATTVAGTRIRGRRRRQDVEGDGRVGGRGAGDHRGEVEGLEVEGRLHERHGDGDAVLDKDLGQLDHRHQVAGAEARVENHSFLHLASCTAHLELALAFLEGRGRWRVLH
ncbi:hypothetical protein SORBI_3005G120101 [Sorghum bicolor]|uniref:Uncharacterized protein n=1 Tax=Sorghum bicolor TaxID=4558 RepID=A0A1Z5RIU2_SORBI|nr:hypothetical protein SORBI_3005G120101 [Sorghum bicolor]